MQHNKTSQLPKAARTYVKNTLKHSSRKRVQSSLMANSTNVIQS